MKRAFEEDEIE